MLYSEIKYGEILYAAGLDTGGQEEPFVDLMRYLPPYWHVYYEMIELQKALGYEIGALYAGQAQASEQMFLDTAEEALVLWEQDFGLDSDSRKSTVFRRERVRSKLRGAGTTTKKMIENMAASFAGGEVEVIEVPDEYRFIVKFVGVKGVPANMADLEAAIEEIKPAHLTFEFAYTYNWWDALKDRTWNSLSTYTWEQVRTV